MQPSPSDSNLHASVLTAIVASIIAVASADAQTLNAMDHSGYVSGGVLVSMQPQGESDCPYLCDPFGGRAWGFMAGGGVRVRRDVAIGVEFSRAGALTGSQSLRVSGGDFLSQTSHRDTMASGVLRFSRAAPDDAVAVMFIGGGGMAVRQTRRKGEISRGVPGGIVGTPHQEQLTDVVPAVLGGVDVAIGAGRRTAIVPFARAHYLLDNDRTESGPVKRGVSSFIFRAGASIEVRF